MIWLVVVVVVMFQTKRKKEINENKCTDNLVPLIDVISAREKNIATDHFTHDAANRPQINIFFVAHTKNHLKKRKQKNKPKET